MFKCAYIVAMFESILCNTIEICFSGLVWTEVNFTSNVMFKCKTLDTRLALLTACLKSRLKVIRNMDMLNFKDYKWRQVSLHRF